MIFEFLISSPFHAFEYGSMEGSREQTRKKNEKLLTAAQSRVCSFLHLNYYSAYAQEFKQKLNILTNKSMGIQVETIERNGKYICWHEVRTK